MKIRPVKKSDVPQIVKLIGAVWAEYDCRLDVEREERELLAPGDYFRAKGGRFWVAEAEKELAATVAVMMTDAETAELKYLYVGQNQRNRGLGERLTKLAIDFARGRGARLMILWSDTRFTRAHRLYDRLGFTRFDTRRLDDLNNSVEYGFRISL